MQQREIGEQPVEDDKHQTEQNAYEDAHADATGALLNLRERQRQ